MSPAESALSPEERRAFDRGILEFNEGLFFECHDTLEDLWSGIRGPSREFFQGLIQVSVAFYHLTSGNASGAASMLRRAMKRLQGYPDLYFGLELDSLKKELGGWLERIGRGDIVLTEGDTLPKWRFRKMPE